MDADAGDDSSGSCVALAGEDELADTEFPSPLPALEEETTVNEFASRTSFEITASDVAEEDDDSGGTAGEEVPEINAGADDALDDAICSSTCGDGTKSTACCTIAPDAEDEE